MARRRQRSTDVVYVGGSVPVNSFQIERRGFLPWAGRVVSAPFRLAARVGKRAITSLPWSAGGDSPSLGAEQDALSLIPFFASIRLIADHVASFPLHTFRDVDGVNVKITDHPLFRREAIQGSLFDWLHQCVVSLAMHGNAYGYILDRDGFGFPTLLEWLPPNEVHVDESEAQPRYLWKGNLLPRENIVHIPWFRVPGSVVGLSPLRAFARSIGGGLAADIYGKQFFEHGGQPPGKFKNTKKTVTQDEADEIKERLLAALRTHRPLVYGEDWEYEPLRTGGVGNEDAQFIQTLKLNATQMANIFGVPPTMVGGESGGPLTYENVIRMPDLLVRFTLRPYIIRLEQAFSQLLPERQAVRFNVDALVRADIKTRYEAHKIALEAGFLTVDEVREYEERPPLPRPPQLVQVGEPEVEDPQVLELPVGSNGGQS